VTHIQGGCFMHAVTVENLTKIYSGGKKAVDNVSFSIEPGKVFGFLGPNGAGKATAVQLLNGGLAPTEGVCRVFDLDVTDRPERIHAFSGVLTEHAQMYGHLTGLANLLFYGAVFGVNPGESKKRALQLLEELELVDAKDRKLETYSTGMRQRLSLARAMIHRPKILFLDEPTSGLDPESVMSVNKLIKNLADTEGVTVFLCTHQLRYAQEICNAYGLIDDGVLLAHGSIDELRAMVFSGTIVSVEADRIPGDIEYTKTGERLFDIEVQSGDDIPDIVRRIVNAGGNIYNVTSHKLSLEEIYFSLIEKRKTSKGMSKPWEVAK